MRSSHAGQIPLEADGVYSAPKAGEMSKIIRLRKLILVAAILAAIFGGATGLFSQQDSPPFLAGMRWRLIGPFRGGRVLAVSGVPGNPNEYFFGAVGGGVWKTKNAGQTWQPVFDGPIASIGALSIAPSEPNTIYVGTGEADMRSDISFGDGMYKSTDGGSTWKNIGLRDSRHIGRILVDPRDPNIVLVAALGHAFGPNPERGVYRSTDGGATWRKVLSKDDDTGAIDLCFDPGNAHVVYASLWQARRPPWSVYAAASGPGSGLYKSTDGGLTWKQIVGNGFPSEGLGRIGIAVAAGENGNRIYAIVDAREGGLYRSDDAGNSWKRTSSDHRIWERGWYFGGITADPRDANVVYVANTALYRSTDGGSTFTAIKGAPGGDDYHFLWITPDDPERMILGCDQGAAVTVDGGKSWSSWYNQPTAQFYHVVTDNHFPYRVYGAQQDSGTAAVTSRSDYGEISFRDWSPVGGDESGYIVPAPDEPVVYGGGPYGVVTRFDWVTGQSHDISPWPSFGVGNKLRFTWTSPLVISPQNPRLLYLGAQFVLRTEDRGMSWQTISPDLTVKASASNAAAKKEEDRGVVYTIAPSTVRAGEIWTGSDNGLIYLTADEGKTWTDVTPPNLGDWSMISLIEASHFDAATAYAAIDRHQVDDFHPYIFRTHDSGKTWQNSAAGLPAQVYVHVVREDPVRKGLLFAGTETGVYVSFDDGDHWQPLQLNLPGASIRDIAIHGDDLIVATHGRSFWILDDLEPLREWDERLASADAHLFHPQNALRIRRTENHDTPLPLETPVGENPPGGAVIDYYLKTPIDGEVAIEIRDVAGSLVRRFSSERNSKPVHEPPAFPENWLPAEAPVSKLAGAHRFVWDLRYPRPVALRDEYSIGAVIGRGTVAEPEGPLALPGEYEVRLIVAGKTYKQPLQVKMDPRVQVPGDDLAKQLELQLRISGDLTKATNTYREIADVRAQLHAVKARVAGNASAKSLLPAIGEFDNRAGAIAGRTDEAWPSSSEGLTHLDGSLASLENSAGSADSAPTAQSYAAFELFDKNLQDKLSKWDELKKQDLAALNKQLQQAGIPQLAPSASGKPVGE